MSDSAARVVILGGGVSGLTTAWKLSQRGVPVTVLEREDQVGGLARSSRVGAASFDYGPHQLYTNFDDVVREWEDLLGDDLLVRNKEARVRFRGRILHYPLSTGDILGNIPVLLSARCFAEFAWTSLRNTFVKPEDRSFEDWVVRRFGRTLYDIHFGPYTAKVWGIPPTQMSAAAAEKRIAVQNLWDVLLKTLSKKRADFAIKTKIHHSPYQTEYRYPRGGIGLLAARMRERVLAAGGEVRTGFTVEAVDLERREVGGRVAGQEVTVPWGRLVSTLPIHRFPGLCRPAPPDAVLATAARLRFRAMRFLNLVVRRAQVSPAHWIYFPEPHLSFQRSAEYSNFSPECAPAGSAAFSLEIPCFVGDARWKASDEEIRAEALGGLREVGILDEKDIMASSVTRVEEAYPVFEIGASDWAESVLAYFKAEHPDVHFTGRQARFSYINIDHCMHFANLLAQSLLRAPPGAPREA